MASSLFTSPARAAGSNAAAGIDPQTIQQVKRMMGMLRAASNPRQAIMQAAQMNPALGSVMQMVSGRNPKDVFYEQCRQRGINPDDVINMLK